MSELRDVTGFGTVLDSPDLPAGFTSRFVSKRVEVGELALHAVVGGRGEALLLVGGWPQFWWQWRLVMMRLSEQFRVIAVDPPGMGRSDRPDTGYDAGTCAAHLHVLMDRLGHDTFHLVGHDVGMWLAYALASDFPDEVSSLTLMEANLPGITEHPSVVPDNLHVAQVQWHFMFNRLPDVNERLVAGREDVFFSDQFSVKGATPSAIPAGAVDVYVRMLREAGALHACFNYYRAIDVTAEQNRHRRNRLLPMPVLAIGGERSRSRSVFDDVSKLAENVRGMVLEGCGHYVAEEAPGAFVRALTEFISRRSGV